MCRELLKAVCSKIDFSFFLMFCFSCCFAFAYFGGNFYPSAKIFLTKKTVKFFLGLYT